MNTRTATFGSSRRVLLRALTTAVVFVVGGIALRSTAADIAPLTRIDVVPAVAAPGISRTITVNIVWPDGCPPDQAFASPVPQANPQFLLVRLPTPETSVVCPPVQTPISRQVTYTPQAAGVMPINALTSSNLTLVEGNVVTRDSTEYPNLNGLWIGMGNDFSVFQITQSSWGGEVLVGTLNLFARDGSPQWRLVHSSRRSSHNTIYASVSAIAGSTPRPCLGLLCPSDGFDASDEGILEIEVQSENQIVVTARATDALPSPYPARFRSLMYRFPL